MKTTPAVVLGFYYDPSTSARILRDVQRNGFRRSILIRESQPYQTSGGRRFDVRGSILWGGPLIAAILLVIVAFGIFQSSPGSSSATWLALLFFLAAIGSAAAGAVRRQSSRVDHDVTSRFRRWVLPGESVIVVQVPIEQAGQVLEMLRPLDGAEPATFVIRRSPRFAKSPDEPVFRERFTVEILKHEAAQLAARQRVTSHPKKQFPLLDRVGKAEETIETITSDLTHVGRLDQGTSLATEWLLDNVYVIKRHAADVRRNLSRGFYEVLPVLESEPHADEPRIYEIALELVAHTNGGIHEQDIVDFLLAYQEITPLTIGELWVLPLLLRLGLIESLARLATAVDLRQFEHEQADLWANRILSAGRHAPSHLILAAAELAREQPRPSPYVIDRIVSQLQGEASALDTVRAWLERKVDASLADVIQQEQRRHAADQVAIANAIGSLRELSRVDWRDIFEQVNPVDRVLASEPSLVYQQMDFGTRDQYRQAVEAIARSCDSTETDVAQAAIELARSGGNDLRRSHVGYYLIDVGRRDLETSLRCHVGIGQSLRRATLNRPRLIYLAGIGLTTAVVLIIAFVAGGALGLARVPPLNLLLLVALAVFPASEIGVFLINQFVTRTLPPRALPKLALDSGIPDQYSTLVIVPTLLQSPRSIREDLDNLEIRFLANQDANLQFALLADFTDGSQRIMSDDAELLDASIRGTNGLNERYPGNRFSLFYRDRTWSDGEQVWMGWERKRGKIEELNRWLVNLGNHHDSADGNDSTTLHYEGDPTCLAGVRFVLTLDADTQLPRDAARNLVGTLAHPLNQPQLAPDGRTVQTGYTIIQPRTSTNLPSATATRFSRLMAGAAGTDPYTRAVSDVYQDLVGEGSYHGKGIYDLAMFHQVLDHRFPEATLLSHDLLEGAHVRVGLASDIELFDQFPATYRNYSVRQHRWTRGDWQIADWCTPWVPGPNGSRQANPLSAINRWKIADNLRRSLVPVGCIALLVAGWLLQPSFAAIWATLVGVAVLLPPTVRFADWIGSRLTSPSRVSMPGEGWREVATTWGAAIFSVAVLPYEAATTLDAIRQVFYRRLLSHRGLLEWQTSRMAHQGAQERERHFALKLAGVTAFAVALAGVLAISAPGVVLVAVPYLAFWAAAPFIVLWLGRVGKNTANASVSSSDRRFLRRIARQTWRYFDDLVGPQTNWLPPDNYQIALRTEVAPRTSPTNIGLWLLSTVAANDFGYLTGDQVIERGLATFETLLLLERHEGHILNWYDVQTLVPLNPRYVSTVDSGNLLASLWTLGRAYEDVASRPILGLSALHGLEDTLDLVQAALLRDGTGRAPRDSVSALSDLTAKLADLFADAPDSLVDIVRRLRLAVIPAHALAERLALPMSQAPDFGMARPGVAPTEAELGRLESEAIYWARQLDRQVNDWLSVVDRYLPTLSSSTDRSTVANGPSRAPSLRALAEAPVGLAVDGDEWAARLAAVEMLEQAHRLRDLAMDLASELRMEFLYNPQRRLFSTGYNVDAWRLDPSCYDLLASESRLASFISIARGDVPVDHWLTLGRPYGMVDGKPALLSWTGTMFEYLMPLLFTRRYDFSLLDAACRQAVFCQIAYGEQRGIPWGMSEAAFAAVDVHQIYQYQAFGVPGLGLKRGLEDDLVIAPYATALALLVDRPAAIRNLKRLARTGAAGAYGYYDAIDYTAERQAEGRREIIVATYMAHHQGMTLLSLDNALYDNAMQQRFHANPLVRAAEPLLFERIPASLPIVEGEEGREPPDRASQEGQSAMVTRFESVDTVVPRTHLLGHRTYSIVVTAAGGGYSRWRDVDISRWRSDPTLDSWGSFVYVQDIEQGTAWSTSYQPTGRTTSRYAATFASDRVTFERRDVGIETVTEIVVSPEDDAEVRRLTLVNRSDRRRRLQVTSYVELALAARNADRGHPVFSKMFVETEALLDRRALLAWRKPRTPHDAPVFAAHVLVAPTLIDGSIGFDTNRTHFIGRGHTLTNPAALSGPLSSQAGSPLDPIFSLRGQFTLEPGERAQLAFVTLAADSREQALALVAKFQELREVERTYELASYQAQLEPRHLRVSADEIQRFQQLVSYMLFPNARLRAAEGRLRQNRLGQNRLWAHGISGDQPVLVVTIGDQRDADLVREALLAHTFWRLRGFKVDLVILNEEAGSYDQPLQGYLKTLVQAHAQYTGLDLPGGIFLRQADQIPAEDLTLILTVARVVLVASRGPLVQQLSAPVEAVKVPPALAVTAKPAGDPPLPLPFLVLPYFNGVGGFTEDGKEYAIYLGPGVQTPTPWINVMANPSFGALLSESGSGFAWYGNSQSNRLLPWSNDPVVDPTGDAIYLRDEESGVFWTPTARPIRERDAYRARHGQGYTLFEHNSHGIEQELLTFVPLDDSGGSPVRIQRLRLTNRTTRRRRLSATFYAEWVLGGTPEETQMHIVTNWDTESQALLARNLYHADYGRRVAFASCSQPVASYSGDRAAFLGRNGTHARPVAMARQSLGGRAGVGLDPCAALQVTVDLLPGREVDVTFLFGEAADILEARRLARLYREPIQVEQALAATRSWWDRFLEVVQVETPDLAVNLLLNRWLLYQTLSCRIWARSAFYQSGGAFGFRDQLQDVMAVLYAAPHLARQQILTAAARQFREGDVQHWWHPQTGAGVRTRISDDLLWLPYVVTQYVRVTGDVEILDEVVPFLEGHVLDAGEAEAFFVPTPSLEVGSILEHCRRAIARGTTSGPRGLPLIGTGDWNDGLSLVGAGGKGESVWLAWFLIDVLNGFAELVERRGQTEEADAHRTRAKELSAAVEVQAWDGAWYRRAYYDDGTPFGSQENLEARIDSLPQSWGVISGAAIPGRADQALRAVEEQLIRDQDGLVLLFTPPLENAPENPGYVKGYPPGVRENGGQYTHGAVWVALAFARRGEGDRAARVLRILNPVEHARTPEDVERYKVEPYVVAADVYSLEGQVGRGGWTWYTGSSGWLYRVWIEDVLGFKLRVDRLTIDPSVPSAWATFTLRYRYRSTTYEIVVDNPDRVCHGVAWLDVDGQRQKEPVVSLQDDGGSHKVSVRLGPPPP